MNENEKDVLGQEEEADKDLDLLEEIKNLKKNSVSKEEYNKQVEKNKALMKQIINGGGREEKTDEPVDINALRKEIFENPEGLSDRDFWKKTLMLRKERLEREGVDIFLPKGRKTRYTRDDLESAQHVADTIGQILEDTEDNPNLFKTLLNDAIN